MSTAHLPDVGGAEYCWQSFTKLKTKLFKHIKQNLASLGFYLSENPPIDLVEILNGFGLLCELAAEWVRGVCFSCKLSSKTSPIYLESWGSNSAENERKTEPKISNHFAVRYPAAVGHRKKVRNGHRKLYHSCVPQGSQAGF